MGQDLSRGKNRTVTADFKTFFGLAGHCVKRLKGKVNSIGDLFNESAGSGRTFSVHLKIYSLTPIIYLHNFVILAADVNQSQSLRQISEPPVGMTGDLGFGCRSEVDAMSAVTGRNNRHTIP